MLLVLSATLSRLLPLQLRFERFQYISLSSICLITYEYVIQSAVLNVIVCEALVKIAT